MKKPILEYLLLFFLVLIGTNSTYAQAPTSIKSINYAKTNFAPSATAMKVDANGNIYVAGKYNGNSVPNFNPFGTTLGMASADGVNDIYIAKYDAGGVLLWINFGLSTNATFLEINGLELDSEANVYVSGYVQGVSAQFYDSEGNYSVLANSANSNEALGAYVIKYSTNGVKSWVWNKSFSGSLLYQAYGLQLVGTTAYVLGKSIGGGNNSLSIAVLAANGSEQSYNILSTSSGTIIPLDFKRDSNGGFVVTGSISNTANLGGSNIVATSQGDVFLAKYFNDYTHIWSKRITSSATAEEGVSVLVDPANGDVFLLAQTNNRTATLLNRFDANGNSIGSASFTLTATGTGAYVKGEKILLDNNQNLFVVGRYRGTSDLDPGPGISNVSDANGGYFWAGYTRAGAFQWRSFNVWNNSVNTSITSTFDSFNKYHISYRYDYSGNVNSYFQSFTFNSDITAPIRSAVSPLDNSSGVSVSTNYVITSSEPVVAVPGGSFSIYKSNGNELFEKITFPSDRVSIVGNTITINPVNDLPLRSTSQAYYVNFSGGAFRDASGNFMNPVTGNSTWNFFSEFDNVAPTISSISPAGGSVNQSVNQNLVATFSKSVFEMDGGIIQLRKSSDATLVESFTLPSARVAVINNTVTIDPTNSLENNTQYYVTIAANTLNDLAGNKFSGNTNTTFWTFTTAAAADTQAPVVTSLFPADNSVDVPAVSNLTITFNENIIGVNGKVIELRRGDNTLIESFTLPTALVVISGNQVVIDPTNDLSSGTEYYVLIEDGTFRDTSNNLFEGITNPSTWNFTSASTVDATPPTIVSIFPAYGDENVPVNSVFQITFSEPVVPNVDGLLQLGNLGTGGIVSGSTLNFPSSLVSIEDNVVSFTWPVDVPGNSNLWVYVAPNSFRDLANNNHVNTFDGNSLTNSLGWTFSTEFVADLVPPTLVSTNPTNGAVDVPVTGTLQMFFSEFIELGTSKVIQVNRVDNGNTVANFQIPGAFVSKSGTLLNLNLPNDLPFDTELYVAVQEGAVTDVQGNPYAGINSTTTWRFRTLASDETPELLALYPENNSTDIPVSVSSVVLHLSRYVSPNLNDTEGINLYKSDGSLVYSWDLPLLGGGYDLYRFSFDEFLEPSTTYYITIGANTLRTGDGAFFEGLIGDQQWRFTTADAASVYAPIISYSPARGANNVSISLDTIRLIFDREIWDESGKIRLRKTADQSVVIEWDTYEDIIYRYNGSQTEVLLPINITLDAGVSYSIDNKYNASGEQDPGLWNYEFAYNQSEDIWVSVRINPWDNTYWTFTTETASEPLSLLGVSIDDNSPIVGIAPTIVLTFDQEVFPTGADGFTRVYRADDNSLVDEIQLYGTENIYIEFNGSEVTLYTNTLDFNTEYYVHVIHAIEGANESVFTINDDQTIRFTTREQDVTPPSLVSIYPANGEQSVLFDDTYSLTFDEKVAIQADGTKFFHLHRVSDNGLIYSLPINYSTIGFSEDQQTLTLKFDHAGTQHFRLNTAYYILMDEGAVLDYENNPADILQDTSDWSFKTETVEEAAQVYSQFAPTRNANNVSAAMEELSIEFAFNVTRGAGLIRLNLEGEGILKTWTIESSDEILVENNQVRITGLPTLVAGGVYYIELIGALGGGFGSETYGAFDGPNGQRLWTWRNDPTFWRFTIVTPDVSAPQVISYYPAIGEQKVPFKRDIILEFDEEIGLSGTSGTFDIYNASNNSEPIRSYTFSPFNSTLMRIEGNRLIVDPGVLACGTDYYIELSENVLKDASGNLVEGIQGVTTWTFSTETRSEAFDVYQSFLPSNGSTNVSVSLGELTVSFTENVVATENEFARFVLYTEELVEVKRFYVQDAIFEGNTIRFVDVPELDYNTTYIMMHEGQEATQACDGDFLYFNTIIGENNRAIIGFGGNYNLWRFITEEEPEVDTTPPTIVSISPINGASGVSINPEFVITLSESVVINEAGFPFVRLLLDGNIIETIQLNDEALVSIEQNVIHVNFATTLDYNTFYQFTTTSQMVKDLSGNILTQNALIGFTTRGEECPSIAAPLVESISRCGAGNVTLTASGAESGQIYVWYDAPEGTILKTSANASDNSYTASFTANTSVFVKIQQDDCESELVAAEITIQTLPSFTLQTVQATCGEANGSITVNTASTDVNIFLNATNQGTNTNFTGLAAGTYEIRMVNTTTGCEVSESVTLNPSVAVSASVSVSNPTACDVSVGQIMINSLVGTAPFEIYLNNELVQTNVSSSLVLENIESGNYTLQIIDASGCEFSQEALINQASVITANVTKVDVSVCQGSNGSITMSNVSGGEVPYEYRINGAINPAGATNAVFSGLAGGTYQVEVRDANGCFFRQNVSIATPALFEVEASLTQNLCFGDASGSISLEIVGGTEPITFLWNTGATTSEIQNLVAGNYTVLVSDAFNCQQNLEFTITQPTQLQVSGVTTQSAFFQQTGTINITVTGGMAPYTYVWSNAAQTEDLTGLAGGQYSVTVSDANGCTAQASFEVTVDVVGAIHQLNSAPLKLFPNPAQHQVTIQLDIEQVVEIQLEMVNLLGERIWFKDFGRVAQINEQVDMSLLRNGVYLLNIISGNTVRTEKVLKQ